MTPVSWLLERIEQWRDAPAIAWNNRENTYGQLVESVQEWGRYLDRAGIGRGRVVMIRAEFSPPAVALLLALIDRGAIIVPVSSSAEPDRDAFARIAEVEFSIRVDATAGRHDLEGLDPTVRHPLLKSLVREGKPGLVLFTSGTTGEPKAVLHDLDRFLEKFRAHRAGFRSVALLLFDHVAGLDNLFYTLASGGMLICVVQSTPEAVCEAIERFRAELLPATVSFLNLLLVSEVYARHDLSSLKLVAYGSEVMPPSTLRRLAEILPGCRFLQKYGTTELGSPRTKTREDGSVWLRIDTEGMETRIVDGVLWVRSPTAMMGYLNAPSPFDNEGWMNTEDLVETDGEWICILGRQTDLINIGGQKVYPSEVESVLLEIDNVSEALVYGEPNPLMGRILAARVRLQHPEPLDQLKSRIRGYCHDRLPSYKIPVRILLASDDILSRRMKKPRREPS